MNGCTRGCDVDRRRHLPVSSFRTKRHTQQYAELKDRVRQLEEELEAAAGANEAIKHANDLRVAKMCVRGLVRPSAFLVKE